MESIDSKVFAAISLATLVFISIFKSLAPTFVKGKEMGLALLLPILFTVGAKCGGFFAATEWLDAIMWALGSGMASGVAHDKLLNPGKKAASALLPKKAPVG